MSVMYFLVCEKHKKFVYITDNKGNPPSRLPVREFILDHCVDEKCDVHLMNEYDMDALSDEYDGYWDYEEAH